MKLVVAGNFREYDYYCKINKLDRKEAKYISSPNDMFGFHNVEIIYYGTYYMRKDYFQIREKEMDVNFLMNTRKVGKKLETYVSAILEDIDPKARPTIGSGSKTEISDVLSKHFYIECKKRNTKDITLKKQVWDKLCAEIPVGSQKIPLYILENISKDRFVVLDIKDFIRMIGELHGKT